jgi:hypothetical protein
MWRGGKKWPLLSPRRNFLSVFILCHASTEYHISFPQIFISRHLIGGFILHKMSNPRLPFLYPNLFRSIRSCEPTSPAVVYPIRASLYVRRIPPSTTSFHASCRRFEQETRRYGPARESQLPPPPKPQDNARKNETSVAAHEKRVKDDDKIPQSHQRIVTNPVEQSEKPDRELTSSKATPSTDSKTPASSGSNLEKATPNNGEHNSNGTNAAEVHESTDNNGDVSEQSERGAPLVNPLETVLQMPSPSNVIPSTATEPNSRKPPHLSPPRYVHHFDTYSLVKDLDKGGFKEDQAVSVMKSIRGILQDKLELARESLTSKSDIENELYLFKAACSELQSALQTARNAETQRQRSSRMHLQHEVDILTQRLNQELARLNDELKGMFNDHKMTTKEFTRSIDTAIQELNYQITISLNSDGKGEVEGLRWVLTRRAAMAIATSACKF